MVSADVPKQQIEETGNVPTAEPEHPTDGATDRHGWTTVSGVYRVPTKATRAVVELHLQWAPNGIAEWSDVEFAATATPAPRKVRLATIHYQAVGKVAARELRGVRSRWWPRPHRQQADLVVLGETVPYVNVKKKPHETAEPVPGPTTEYFGGLAATHKLHLVLSLYERERHLVYNTAVLLGPDGKLIGKYRKVCLPHGEVEEGVAAGSEYPVFDTKFGKVGMMVCYDGFFPEVARELSNRGAEVIAWPVWGCNPRLAAARACENHVYLISSTYMKPKDGWMISAVYDQTGKPIATADEYGTVAVAEVDLGQPYIGPWNLGDFHSMVPRHRPIDVTQRAARAQDTDAAASTEEKDAAKVLELPIRVVDKAGQPVAKAKITPWALRSSQGHGWWRKDDKWTEVVPKAVRTDSEGKATVLYPHYRISQEQVRTTAVSLSVDHPSYAYTDDVHIDVPLEKSEPYEIKLMAGVPLEIRPLIDGMPIELDDVFARWSDGRSWLPGVSPEKLADGTLRIPAMLPGENSVLLVKLDGDRATHFSKIEDFKIRESEPNQIDISLLPSVRIKGVLSDNVPRPVRNGRVKAETLAPAEASSNRVVLVHVGSYSSGWHICDRWLACERGITGDRIVRRIHSNFGKAPTEVKNPRDPSNDYYRPQVLRPTDGQQVEVAMTPLVRCVATAVDEDGKPTAGITVESWPNVGWWNGGSQIYCHPLVRGERLLQKRDFGDAIDAALPQPFHAVTNAQGKAVLELPAGKESLSVTSEAYELPVFLGDREVQVTLTRGETTEAVLSLQPKGTEKLGEWDKLAGVVFGCSTREGRRICALPGVQTKMDEFAKRFRDGKNQRDPQLLFDAYSLVADAFFDVGDVVEGVKWRKKAAEQAAKAAK